ncbi:hypothetical protein VZT92_001110 [Zoarces viviparus]|uniref:Uncharacterized protein n=1 Tax=Zoarces viviparus TaxID=48416 RepID=A0AAW1G9F5_ZOAVI
MRGALAALVTLDNLEPIAGPRGGDVSFKYQLSMVLSVPTMVTTGNGESGFDSDRIIAGPCGLIGLLPPGTQLSSLLRREHEGFNVSSPVLASAVMGWSARGFVIPFEIIETWLKYNSNRHKSV